VFYSRRLLLDRGDCCLVLWIHVASNSVGRICAVLHLEIGMTPVLHFDRDDAQAASDSWNCNCGPSALAAICGINLEQVRYVAEYVEFAARGYMNSTMMSEALQRLNRQYTPKRLRPDRRTECDVESLPAHGLARIQFGGPWIINGKPARWAAQHTHWIASWKGDLEFVVRGERLKECTVFDINCGLLDFAAWEADILPLIMKSIKRCDGDWFVTNSWEVSQLERKPDGDS
jgi:hypothetical protein